MRVSSRSALVSVALALGVGLIPAARASAAGEPVNVVVLKEHGVGTPATAQPYLDKFMDIAAKENGWGGGAGKYQTQRAAAEAWIQGNKPHYGILSLGAFLGLKGTYGLEPIGQVAVTQAGGQQYFVVSKTAGDLAGCKGKKLVSDHIDDAPFIEKVVFDGKAKLSDFTLVPTKRSTQTSKTVINDEAECALIDDAQMAELPKLDGGAAVKQVWASAKLPALVVVAFPAAPGAEKSAFQGSLPRLCQGGGTQICNEVGIQSLTSAGASTYAAVVAAYARP